MTLAASKEPSGPPDGTTTRGWGAVMRLVADSAQQKKTGCPVLLGAGKRPPVAHKIVRCFLAYGPDRPGRGSCWLRDSSSFSRKNTVGTSAPYAQTDFARLDWVLSGGPGRLRQGLHLRYYVTIQVGVWIRNTG